MKMIHHHYFGDLHCPSASKDAIWVGDLRCPDASTDVIWERELNLGDAHVEVWLWMDPIESFDPIRLDAFAALLVDLNTLDASARDHLKTYLEADRSFIDDHVEALNETGVIAKLIQDADEEPIEADRFVAAMQLSRIGLWIGMSSSPVVMDYVIDSEHSDQILAVKTTENGSVVSIDWES
jgi:hypothetical protein